MMIFYSRKKKSHGKCYLPMFSKVVQDANETQAFLAPDFHLRVNVFNTYWLQMAVFITVRVDVS